jgi:hypothetical protein
MVDWSDVIPATTASDFLATIVDILPTIMPIVLGVAAIGLGVGMLRRYLKA